MSGFSRMARATRKRGLAVTSDWFLAWSARGWILVVLGTLASGYVGITFSDALSFRVDDGWCPEGTRVLGNHCWGDFGFPYQRGGQGQIYMPGNLAAANTPLTNLLFELIRLLPYVLGLSAVLAAIAVSVIGAVYVGTTHLPASSRALAVFFAGIGTLGAIASIDRANWVGMFPLLLVAYAGAIKRRLWIQAGLILAVLASLKFWAILFAIPLIMARRSRALWVAGVTILALYVLPLAVLPGPPTIKLQVMLEAVLDREYAAEIAKYSISIPAFANRLWCLADAQCDAASSTSRWVGIPYVAYGLIAGLVIWAAWMARRYKHDWFLAIAPTIALGFLAVPEAAAYNLVLTVAVGALFLRRISATNGKGLVERARSTYWAFGVALIVTNVPIPLRFLDFGIDAFGYARWATLAVPLVWCAVIAVSVAEAATRVQVSGERPLGRSGSRGGSRCRFLPLVFLSLGAIASVAVTMPLEQPMRTTRLFGGQAYTSSVEVGQGTGRDLLIRPKNYLVQGPEMALYFPAKSEGAGVRCPAAEARFTWDGVFISIPESGIEHTFVLIGIDDATLALDAEGKELTWSTTDSRQVLGLPGGLCLGLEGAQVAASSTYHLDIGFGDGGASSETGRTSIPARIGLLLLGAVAGLASYRLCNQRTGVTN